MRTDFRSLALTSLFAAWIAVLGLVPKIDLPLGVPMTLQTLGVMLAGCLLGPRRAAQATVLFLIAVAVGLPLLAGGRGGLGVFMAPSAGYLVGWPLGALVTGWVFTHLPRATPRAIAVSAVVASALGGIAVIHLCGVVGLVALAGFQWGQAALGTLVFVPGDMLKCLVCGFIANAVARGLPQWPLAASR